MTALPLSVRIGASHHVAKDPTRCACGWPIPQSADGEPSAAAHAAHVADETAKALAPQSALTLTIDERRTVVHAYPEFTIEFQESVAADLGVERTAVLRALGRAARYLRRARSVPDMGCTDG